MHLLLLVFLRLLQSLGATQLLFGRRHLVDRGRGLLVPRLLLHVLLVLLLRRHLIADRIAISAKICNNIVFDNLDNIS